MTDHEIEMFEAYLDSEAGLPFNGDADCTLILEYSPEIADEMYADDMRTLWL